MEKKLRVASLCVQGGYEPKNGEPIEVPIIQSTTFKYDNSEEMAMLFDLKKEGYFFNLFGVTLKKPGIECTFVNPNASEEEIQKAFRPNTKVVFGETISNPGCAVLDIEKFARIAHKNGVPLIVDNTFATPINCRPFEWGADIVTHSTTKYMDGTASQGGGVVGMYFWARS